MYLYMQRLVPNPNVGFNYDYMGAAEYEFSATKAGREALAKAYIEKDIMASRVLVSEDDSTPIELIAIGRKEFILNNPSMDFVRLKERMRLDDSRFIGWMSVQWKNPTPLLLLRPEYPEIQKAVDLFMRPYWLSNNCVDEDSVRSVAFIVKEQVNGK